MQDSGSTPDISTILINILNIGMSIQLNPLTKAGIFDHEFYTSDNYQSIRDIALKYLYDEGFDIVKGERDVKIQDRYWWVSVR